MDHCYTTSSSTCMPRAACWTREVSFVIISFLDTRVSDATLWFSVAVLQQVVLWPASMFCESLIYAVVTHLMALKYTAWKVYNVRLSDPLISFCNKMTHLILETCAQKMFMAIKLYCCHPPSARPQTNSCGGYLGPSSGWQCLCIALLPTVGASLGILVGEGALVVKQW